MVKIRGSQPRAHVPQGYICLPEGVHLRVAKKEKKLIFVLQYLYIYHLILFSKIIICLLLIISINIDDKIFCHTRFSGRMFICRNAEEVHGKQKVGNPWFR